VKVLYSIGLMLVLMAAGAHSQVLQSYTVVRDTTPNNLPKGGIWFVTENSGSVWISGDSTLVAKADTSNLGVWTKMNTGIPADGINWLEFVSPSVIYGAGYSGAIYKTTDGGSSWNQVYYNAGVTTFIDRITFFDANHGFAWGDGISSSSVQACLETTDGGTTWTNNNSQLVGFASSGIVRFVPPSNVFLTGSYSQSSNYWGVWRSTDGGHSWSFATVGTSPKDSVTQTYSADFKSSLIGVACRKDSTFWSTTDGGVSWQQISSHAQTNFDYVAFIPGTNTVMAGGGGEASIAAVDLDSRTFTVYRDASTNVTFNYVDFPSTTRGYMSNGFNAKFYSTFSSVPLPVELTSFTAYPAVHGVELEWITASENGNYGFNVEARSLDSRQESSTDWRQVGFVYGNGTSAISHHYSYEDAERGPGTYSYRLKQIDRDGKFKYSPSVEVTVSSKPLTFNVAQNYPNPFNPSTTINFTLPIRSRVTLVVYNALGQKEAELVNGEKEAGSYNVTFDASGLPSGTYFYRLQTGSFSSVNKLELLK